MTLKHYKGHFHALVNVVHTIHIISHVVQILGVGGVTPIQDGVNPTRGEYESRSGPSGTFPPKSRRQPRDRRRRRRPTRPPAWLPDGKI